MSTPVPAIEVIGISKSFAAQKALDTVDLTVAPGEVHALLGENGSGKSTLIKVLAGFHPPDPGAGEIYIEGQPLDFASPSASHAAGLRFVHQRLAVIPEFNAVENMAMELGYTRGAFIDWKAQERETRTLLARLQVDMDIWKPLGQCKPVERSAVAIARAIATHRGHVSTVVLDEPTSSLPEPEVAILFGVIRELTSAGIAVIYVSHRLDEVFQIADRVTVLRDGRKQGTVERATLTREHLIEMIVGRSLTEAYDAVAPPETAADSDETLLAVQDLSAGRIEGLSFRLAKGEVLGFVGLAGSGREDVARALVGGIPVAEGRVSVLGEAVSPLNAKRAIEKGVVLGLSNTQLGSALRDFDVTENTTLASLRRYRPRFGPLSGRRERRDTMRWIHDLDIRPTDPTRTYALLSGGNQQKVILGRCLNAQPAVLVLDDPTAGVDVGARQSLYELIARESADGLGVVICSNDLEDVMKTCHRALVMRHGRVVAEITGELDEHRLLSIAAHGADDEATPSTPGSAPAAVAPQVNGDVSDS